ncbi:MAG: histidine kinase, partial [Pseudomonadales bacterium]|nr:histidine kinase [Pseudomonadales bacterium]
MARTRRHSLRGRLLLTASLVLFVFLGLMGLVLDQAFQRSAEEGVSERLLLHIYGLLAVTEVDDAIYLPEHLQEPDFNRLGSGLYGYVFSGGGAELWRSQSGLGLDLPPEEKVELFSGLQTGVQRFGRVRDTDGERLFYLSYRVLWQGADQQSHPYIFTTLQTLDPYRSEIRGFRNNLWGWLVGVAVVLILVQGVVMRWGLLPLRQLAEDLKAIEDGDRDMLGGD